MGAMITDRGRRGRRRDLLGAKITDRGRRGRRRDLLGAMITDRGRRGRRRDLLGAMITDRGRRGRGLLWEQGRWTLCGVLTGDASNQAWNKGVRDGESVPAHLLL